MKQATLSFGMLLFLNLTLGSGTNLGIGLGLLQGADPVPTSDPQKMPVTRTIILDNESIIEGIVTIEGDEGESIRVQRNGGVLLVPAKRTLKIVNSRIDAYAFIRQRANLGDADERLRIARWCMTNDLKEQAILEAEAAAKMRPGFSDAENMARALRQLAAMPKPSISTAPPDKSRVQQEVMEVVPLVYNLEAYPAFVTKVQPLLMNLCASCHAGEESGNFKLVRVALGNRKGVTQNLASTLKQIRADEPLKSPLLYKALIAHGKSTEPPIKSKNAPAYQTLEVWARYALAPEGTPEPAPLPVVPATPAEKKEPIIGTAKPNPITDPFQSPEPSVPAEADVPPAPKATRPQFGEDSKTLPPKKTKEQPDDPFDPAIFNGEITPPKK